MGTSTKKKNEVTIVMVVDLIPISKSTINNYRTKYDFRRLYRYFESDNHTVSEKKRFLYDDPRLDEETKDAIWTAFIDGDKDAYKEEE